MKKRKFLLGTTVAASSQEYSDLNFLTARPTNFRLGTACPRNGTNQSLQQQMASLVAQIIKNLPTIQETQARSLGWEEPLEKGTATRSSIVAWRISWTEKPGGLQSLGSQRVGLD